MKLGPTTVAVVFAALFSLNAFADEQMDRAREAVSSLIEGQASLNSLTQSPIEGVYEAIIGNNIYYVFVKDNHLIIGEAFNLATGESLSGQKQNEAIVGVVEMTPIEDMVVFAAEGETKRHLTVFTDIDCGYCRRLHREVPALNKAGLEVRYMAYPRAGVGSSSYDKIVTVWCDDDPQSAMTASKNGEQLPKATCDNPVANQFNAGSSAGISGTPTLVVDDGTVIGGYLPAENLLQRIGMGQ
ncbi:MAG: DsbC family protein [Acidiferrobacterales bacterium]|nr:DsbC family protein [Acidiferrobacterales bacterium]